MDDARRRATLGAFLRTRRAAVSPAEVGLPGGVRRRTAGLRREEVAMTAGVSTTWYTYLEQGRDIHVSRGVLDGIADALRLTRDERQHLAALAGQEVAGWPARYQETGRGSCGIRRATEYVGADLLGLDFLETAGGDYIPLESNDTPSLAGFPEEARTAVAAVVRAKREG